MPPGPETPLQARSTRLQPLHLGAAMVLRTCGIQCVPANRSPRIIAAGVVEHAGGGAWGAERLATLRRAIDDNLMQVGVAPERRGFWPHITLGRARRPVAAPREQLGRVIAEDAMIQGIAGRSWRAPTFAAREFALMRCALGRTGPTYTKVASYELPG